MIIKLGGDILRNITTIQAGTELCIEAIEMSIM